MEAYPLLRLFFGEREADVVAIKARAIELITEGKTIMNLSGAGKGVGKMFAMPPAQILFEANAALKYVNPSKYGRRRTKTLSVVSTCD